MCIYIYIYREREGKKERPVQTFEHQILAEKRMRNKTSCPLTS